MHKSLPRGQANWYYETITFLIGAVNYQGVGYA